jgi:hypothetical protein
MKKSRLLLAPIFIFVYSALCSCSNEEEYTPQIASEICNSLNVSLEDKSGEPINCVDLLANGNVSVTEKKSKSKAKIDVVEYDGKKVLSFSVDLPDVKSMTFNDDRTEGVGKVDLLMNIKGTELPLTVNFKYYAASDKSLFGANSIRIQSIEYAGKTITPTEELCIYSIKIRFDGNNTIIEPLL